MKAVIVNRSVMVSIFTVVLLIYGVQGVSYSQDAALAEFSDTSLAIVVRSTLGLNTQDTVDILKIPKAELIKLTRLSAGRTFLERRNLPVITDLTGLEHATQLRTLYLRGNKVSDITPLSQLTELIQIDLWGNRIIDITPLSQLTELRELDLGGPLTGNEIVDITPLSQLTQLTRLNLTSNQISDITTLAELTQLTELGLGSNKLTDADIAPLVQLTRLTVLDLGSNQISDLTLLSQLTQLTRLLLGANQISDLTPLIQLTRLTTLFLEVNQIRDISPIAQLKQLTLLYLSYNQIRDVTALAQLVNLEKLYLNNNQIREVAPLGELAEASLTTLDLNRNQIRDVSPLAKLTYLERLSLRGNPISDTVSLSTLLDVNPNLYIDIEVDTGRGIEVDTGRGIEVVSETGDLTVTASTLQPLIGKTLDDMVVTLTLNGGTYERSIFDIRGAVTVSGIDGVTIPWHDPDREGDTQITVKLEFDGDIDTDSALTFTIGMGAIANYDGPPLTIEIPVPVSAEAETTPSTSATLVISPSSAVSPVVGGQLAFDLNITGGEAVAGYQATVQFDTTALRYVESSNGDYLPTSAFYVEPVVEGNLVKFNAASLSGESNGDGTLVTFTFEVISVKDSTLTLSDVLLTDTDGIAYAPSVENAEITELPQLKEDVSGDGIVNIQDLVLVASNLGQAGQNRADVNGDGVVDIRDLVKVAGALGNNAAAPSLHPQALEMLTATDVQQWLSEAQDLVLTDAISRTGILFLEQLLTVLIPKETVLLTNYPNPFNPET